MLNVFHIGSLECSADRFDWMLFPITVGSPWSDYEDNDRKCCDSVNPGTELDFDGKL